MKCNKCGYSDNGSGDWAHVCGSVAVKKTSMNPRLRQFEKESELEIFGLGAKRHIWEAALEKYAELIVQECATVIEKNLYKNIGWNTSRAVKRHFGIEDEE